MINMPLCGFNKKMLDGIKMFADGALEHGIIERSQKRGVSIDEQFKKEFEEMDVFLKETEKIDKSYLRKQITGATLLARGIYEENQGSIEKYIQTTSNMINLFRDMDDHFYTNLNGDYRRM